MSLLELDSRNPFGTDIEGARYADSPSDADFYMLYPKKRTIRVILGSLDRFQQPILSVASGSDFFPCRMLGLLPPLIIKQHHRTNHFIGSER